MASQKGGEERLQNCENLNSEVVRYLKCIDFARHLEENYCVQVAFKEEWGKAQLLLIGTEEACTSSRDDIQAMRGLSKSFLVPALALTRLRKSHDPGSEVMLQMRKQQLNVGWSINLRAGKLAICCANEDDINEALNILLEQAGISRKEVKEQHSFTDLTSGSSSGNSTSTTPLSPLNPIMKPLNRTQDALTDGVTQTTPSSLPMANLSIVVDNVDTPINTTSTNASDPQPLQDQQQQHAEKIYLTMDQIRFMFFNAKKMNFVQMTNETFGVEVIFDKAQCFIEFRGGVDSVAGAQADFQALLDNLTTKSIAKSKDFMTCLTRDVKPSEIKASLKQAQARVGWDIREGLLWLCGDSDTSVMRAEKAICGLIFIGEFPEVGSLTEAQSKSLSSTEKWKRFEEQVLKEHQTIRLVPSSDFSRITFTLRKDDFADLVPRTLTTFFQSIKFHKAELPITEDFYKLLEGFKEYIRNECSPKEDKVVLNVTESLCTISSLSPDNIEHAKSKLKEMEGQITTRNIEVNSKAQIDWLATEEGIKRLMDICGNAKTIGSLSSEVEDCLLGNRIEVLMGDISDIVLKVSLYGDIINTTVLVHIDFNNGQKLNLV